MEKFGYTRLRIFARGGLSVEPEAIVTIKKVREETEMKQEINSIPINNVEGLKANGIHFAPSTLYKWHHMGQFKTMFIKMGSRLFLDVCEFRKMMEAHRGK